MQIRIANVSMIPSGLNLTIYSNASEICRLCYAVAAVGPLLSLHYYDMGYILNIEQIFALSHWLFNFAIPTILSQNVATVWKCLSNVIEAFHYVPAINPSHI